MGIKRMNKFLGEKNLIKIHNNLNDMIRNNKQTEYQVFNTRNKCYRLAIDTMLYAHKFKYSYNDMIYGFINQIINFLNNRILPIYIIDGLAPDEKSDIIKTRNEKKNRLDKKIDQLKQEMMKESDNNKINQLNTKIKQLTRSNVKISKSDIDNLINLLNHMNIPHIRANGEADALIGLLYENNSIDSCLSEDMDILVFGCRKMIKFSNKKIYEYNLDYILENLDITFDQYIDMCIYFGCDYSRPLPKVNPNTIYDNIYNKTISDFINNSLNTENYNKYIYNFNKAKSVFISSKNNENSRYNNFQIKYNIDWDKLSVFLNNKSKLINYKKKQELYYSIQYINGLITDHKFY